MGQPVVHFEIIGKDGEGLRRYYTDLFECEIDASNQMDYRIITGEWNTNAHGIGISGGDSTGQERYAGHVTF